jgi:hypothetical protein
MCIVMTRPTSNPEAAAIQRGRCVPKTREAVRHRHLFMIPSAENTA